MQAMDGEPTKGKRAKRGAGDGNYRQRPDGLWEVRFTLPNGKRKSLYGKTRREVQEKHRTALREVEQGIDLDAGRLTVAKYLAQWLDASVRPSVKTKTYEGYESIVRVRVAPRIGHLTLSKITPLDLQQLYTQLTADGLSPRSVQHTHRCLHRAFKQALDWNMILRNPCDGTRAPRAHRAEMTVLSRDQAATLLEATREHRMHARYVLAVTCGARQGELLGLRWQDLDLDRSRMVVRQALQRQRGKGLVFVEPKSKRSRRSVVLSEPAVAALRAHRDRQQFERRAAGLEWADFNLVFCSEFGKPLDPSHQTATFKEQLAKARLPVIRFHDLRHTAATLLLGSGVHPKVVSEMLGHATITLTLDTYSHLVPVLHEQAAAVMGELFGT